MSGDRDTLSWFDLIYFHVIKVDLQSVANPNLICTTLEYCRINPPGLQPHLIRNARPSCGKSWWLHTFPRSEEDSPRTQETSSGTGMDLCSHLEAYPWQSVQISSKHSGHHSYVCAALINSLSRVSTVNISDSGASFYDNFFEVFKYVIKLSAVDICILGCWVGTGAGSTTGERKRAKLSSCNSNLSSNTVNLCKQSQGIRYSEACLWSCIFWLQNSVHGSCRHV